MRVTEHVREAELACKDGTPYPFGKIDNDDLQGRPWRESRALPLCETFETIRSAAGDEPITILSAYRTLEYDERLYEADKGAGNVAKPQGSQHPRGRALDIRHKHLSPAQLFTLILGMFQNGDLRHLGGIGLYPTFCHIDVRPRPPSGHLAIWGGTRPSNIV